MTDDKTQVELNKDQGNSWEALVELSIMRHVHAFESEVVDGGRRYDFVIEGKGGEPLALVEVKSGEISDPQQIRDQIDAAARTETGTYIIAHPNPEQVLEFLERHPYLLEYAMQSGVDLIIKDLSNVYPPADSIVKEERAQDPLEAVPEQRADTETQAQGEAPQRDQGNEGRDDRDPDDERFGPHNTPTIELESESGSDSRQGSDDGRSASGEHASATVEEAEAPVEDLAAMISTGDEVPITPTEPVDAVSETEAAVGNAETASMLDGAIDAASEAQALSEVMVAFDVLSGADKNDDSMRDSGDDSTDGGSGIG